MSQGDRGDQPLPKPGAGIGERNSPLVYPSPIVMGKGGREQRGRVRAQQGERPLFTSASKSAQKRMLRSSLQDLELLRRGSM
jgi:hypothetical protein